MTKKIVCIIFILTLASLALLAIRQEQINAAHTIAENHRKMIRLTQQIDQIRVEIETVTSPESITIQPIQELASHDE
ncbi:MAG: hypothetical protein MK073_08285 [Phycisphaerales bacterium]|nr:hypothetical protein [Phycisphaerales bacterium]